MIKLDEYVFLIEANQTWSNTCLAGKDGWQHRGDYKYAKKVLSWLLDNDEDKPEGIYMGKSSEDSKSIIKLTDIKLSDEDKKALEEIRSNISKHTYQDFNKIMSKYGIVWTKINKQQLSGVGSEGNKGNQFEQDFYNDFDEKWASKIKEIVGCKEIKSKSLDGSKNQSRPYNFNSDGTITAGKPGSFDIGHTVTDITLETDKGPVYLSLKSGKLLSFANIGCIGKGTNKIIPRTWYNNPNEELPENGKKLLDMLCIDIDKFRAVFANRANTDNSTKTRKADYKKEDVTSQMKANKNFKTFIKSLIGYGYIMVHQNSGDDVNFIDLREESKLDSLVKNVMSAEVAYPTNAKRVEVHVDMPGIWISFDARPADGGPVPNRIHVRYKFK